jgi:GMC oxidoreductase
VKQPKYKSSLTSEHQLLYMHTAYKLTLLYLHAHHSATHCITQLRIKGLKNIRIVDASVIPTLPGGQTGAVTVMIAEKASDIILKK